MTRTLASLADLRDRGAISARGVRAQEGGPAQPAVAPRAPADRAPATIRGTPATRSPLGSWSRICPSSIAVAIMLLVGFPVHEFSHALAAYRLGDGTAKLFGRLTLNPIAHFDPLGGILLAVTFLASAGRSASAGPSRRRSTRATSQGGRRGEAIVAAAGPLSNLVLAAIVGAARCATSSPTRSCASQVPELVIQMLLTSSSTSTSC